MLNRIHLLLHVTKFSMQIKLLKTNSKKYLLVFSSLILLSAVPFFAGSGLDNPEPMGNYLNNNFPGVLPQGVPYEPVFPNITFNSPLTFNEMPTGNKVIVGQRDGKIYWFDKNPDVSSKNLLIDLSEKVGVVWDGGFLGLALHPDFGTAGSNYFYIYYTTEDENSNDYPNSYTTQSCNSEEYWGNFLVLARYEMNPDNMTVQASSEQVMLKLRMYGTTHRGGGLLFGDDDYLYLTTGDQTAFKKSQDILNNLDGGVLRLDVDKDITKSHPPVRNMPDDHGYADEITGNGYYIPNDNPFLSPSGVNFEEYYSMGHRNPHRMTKDRATGELYVGEIGGGRHEEINVVKKGKNFGWPLYEGLYYSTFCVQNLYNNMPHEEPLVAFPRADANSIIGGYVYRGSEVPELQGKYICADYGNGEEIFTVDINTGAYEQYGNFTSTNVISFGEDNQGELYILKQGNSSLYKITSKNAGLGNTPLLLSQTGAFTDLSSLTPVDGLIPYDLVESFWSDGALKSRWMAIPNDGTHNTSTEKINYSEDDNWDFPVGSVLVKHFELPIDENNPSITKKLETRFSIKASDGNFYFVTYKWNDQQTDAELLTSGLDETINIAKADGSTGTQVWSYPRTIDCITCHNPTSGGTLGPKARYLNKDYTYSKTGRTANQLVTLSQLGILDEVIEDSDTSDILTYKSTTDPNATLDEKARSYLDLNCAYCHRQGTGNRGDFDLRLNLDITQTGLLRASVYSPLGIPGEKIIDAGHPETSILYHRMNSTDPAIRMPILAKNKVDEPAVQLINDWISQLDPDPCASRIIMEKFNNVSGGTIAQLINNTNYPDSPAETRELDEFSIPVDADDNYGVRVKGLLKAPETGVYYFWIAGDDNVQLSLSTDAEEENKTIIAYHGNWTSNQQWNKYSTQKSAGISLIAGQNYYLEALMNEGAGGDNLAVGWRIPSDGNATVPNEVIPCSAFDNINAGSIVNVSGVSLTPDSSTIIEENTLLLTATVLPADASDTSVSWSSSNNAIATVDTNGLVTAISTGIATISVTTTDGSLVDTSVITVEAAPITVTGVSISPETATINVGNTALLTATVVPSNADTKTVSWSSSNTAIASVNANGMVTAVSIGTATISTTTTDGGFVATASIIVQAAPIAVTGVGVTPNTVTMVEGTLQTLIANVLPTNASDKSVSWFSSNTTVASVNTTGAVSAYSAGTATITVTTTDGSFIATSLVTVEAAAIGVTGVSITAPSTTIVAGNTQLLVATVSPSNATNTSVSWLSSDTSIATVDATGLVTGISTGSLSITATTVDGGYTSQVSIEITEDTTNTCTASGSILMQRYDGLSGLLISDLLAMDNYPDNPTTSTSLSQFEIAVNQGDDYGARVSGYLCPPESGTYYFWIAGNNFTELNLSTTADPTDKVRIAHNEGYASSREWNKFTTQKSTGIYLQKGNKYYIEGLLTEGGHGDNLAVGWRKPSDGDGASPTEVLPGSVLSPREVDNIAVTGVSLSPNNVTLQEGESVTIATIFTPSNASDKSVSWSSANTAIATVDSNGIVTAASIGTTNISVVTTDSGHTAQITIEVVSDTPNTCNASGSILMERYDGLTGILISDLLTMVSYPDNPTISTELAKFEITVNQGDDYGARVSGYLCPPESGTYYFWIAGNNHTELNLSTTSNVSDKVRIAHNEDYASSREWNKFGTQKSVGIFLQKGNKYYIEGLLTEGGFGDNLAVGWRKPSDGDGVSPTEVIPGSVLSPRIIDAVAVSGLSLSPENVTLNIGEITTIEVIVSPSNATDTSLSWSSSNTDVATVDTNGLVTGLSVGTASITAVTTDGGFTEQVAINVIEDDTDDCTASGSILMERYDAITGILISNLVEAPNYPDSPSLTLSLSLFEIPVNQGDDYGVRVSGYLCPPESGTYYFWIAGNNHTELNLSTTSEESDKVRIAHNEDFASSREWNKFTTQKSVGIYLQKGNSYYIEGLMKEVGFGDNLAVGWRKPSDGDGVSPIEVIPGAVLSPSASSSANQPFVVDLNKIEANVPSYTMSPNPATTNVAISISNLDTDAEVYYTIYSLIGSEVFSLRGGIKETINVSMLAKGAYQVVIRSGSWTESKKLLVR